MLCGQCGADNPDGHRFCDSCGAPVHVACPACQYPNRATARFCGECGTPLAARSEPAPAREPEPRPAPSPAASLLPEGERRDVTVLFADIRGSTELIQSLDPEQAAEFLDPSVQAMVSAVRRYGGLVSRVQGDGIMALFGAPVAQEDHAAQACFAAWAMLRAIADLGDARTEIRVGLSSGDVVVRPMGNDLTVDYGAIGLTAHMANRVEQACTPGRAWMSEETYRRAAGFVTALDRGVFTLKGIAAPARLYELSGIAVKRDRWAVRAAANALTPFIGREAEMALLVDALRRAIGGRGQVVTVVGEAGMGKSRFVHEFLHRHTAGHTVVRVAAIAHDLSTPYLVAADLLRGLIGVDDEAQAELDARLSAALAGSSSLSALDGAALRWMLSLPVEDADWIGLDPPQRRQRILHAIRAFVLQAAAAEPLVVVVEDAHWIDPESQAALDALVEALGPARLLVVATHRPEFRHDWARRGYHAAIRAVPLDDAAARMLVRDLLGDAPGLDALAARIVERAEGMPFFVEEMARSLAQSGVLAADGENGPRADLAEIEIPTSIRAILAARIDRLPPDERRLLQVASVVGQEIPAAILRSIADCAESEFRRAVDDLQEAEFLFEVELPAGTGYTFKHALTHAVAYEGLLLKQRRFLHVRVLHAVEETYPDRLDELTERLAHHALRGEDWGKAVEYLFKAGRRANEHAAHRRAADLFEQALEALSHLPSTPKTVDRAIEIRLGLRVALGPTADLARILQHLDEAEALARSAGDLRRQAQIHIGRSTFLGLSGALDEAREAGRLGLGIAEQLGDAALRMTACFALGQEHAFRGEFDKARAVLEPETAQLCGAARHSRVGTTGTPSVLGLASLAMTYAMLGTFDAAARSGDQALAIATETKRPYDLSYGNLACGVTALIRGDSPDALPYLETALEQSRDGEIAILFPSVVRFLGRAYALEGRFEEACTVLGNAIAQCRSRSLGTFQAWCEASLAAAHCAMRASEADAISSRSLETARRFQARPAEVQALRTRANVTWFLGKEHDTSVEAAFRQAIDQAETLGMRPELAQSREDFGRFLAERDRIDTARGEIRAAVRTYRALGMTRLATRAALLLTDLEGHPSDREAATGAAVSHR